MVTYRFDVMPHALKVAIPRSYDDTLFEVSDFTNHQRAEKTRVATKQEKSEEMRLKNEEQIQEKHQPIGKHDRDEQQKNLERVKVLLEHGREVKVVGIGPNPAQKGVYIVAGTTIKQSTGEARPVAVCIDESTIVRGQMERMFLLRQCQKATGG